MNIKNLRRLKRLVKHLNVVITFFKSTFGSIVNSTLFRLFISLGKLYVLGQVILGSILLYYTGFDFTEFINNFNEMITQSLTILKDITRKTLNWFSEKLSVSENIELENKSIEAESESNEVVSEIKSEEINKIEHINSLITSENTPIDRNWKSKNTQELAKQLGIELPNQDEIKLTNDEIPFWKKSSYYVTVVVIFAGSFAIYYYHDNITTLVGSFFAGISAYFNKDDGNNNTGSNVEIEIVDNRTELDKHFIDTNNVTKSPFKGFYPGPEVPVEGSSRQLLEGKLEKFSNKKGWIPEDEWHSDVKDTVNGWFKEKPSILSDVVETNILNHNETIPVDPTKESYRDKVVKNLSINTNETFSLSENKVLPNDEWDKKDSELRNTKIDNVSENEFNKKVGRTTRIWASETPITPQSSNNPLNDIDNNNTPKPINKNLP